MDSNQNPSPHDPDLYDNEKCSVSSGSSAELELFVQSTRKILTSQDRGESDEQMKNNSHSLDTALECSGHAETEKRSSITSLPADMENRLTLREHPSTDNLPSDQKVNQGHSERLLSAPEHLSPLNTSSRSLDKLPVENEQSSSGNPETNDVFPMVESINQSNPTEPFGTLSPKGSHSSTKKGRMGIPFFKSKPLTTGPTKQLPMKELQRMIRAGKPSFEQIHSWRNSFETLLNDRFGLALFKDFLSTEFSDENIEFWIACQEYKQITNQKKLSARAQRIFDEFIAVQASREVNLDSKTRLQTEADLTSPNSHTLDNAQKRIQALMEKDSYRRFLRSDVYLTLYSQAREVAKAAAASALAASLQEATSELDGAVLNLVTCSRSQSMIGFRGPHFNSPPCGTGLNLPGVAAAAASAEAGMNSVQDLQLLGLATSRHMRNLPSQTRSTQGSLRKAHTSPSKPGDTNVQTTGDE